MPLTSSRLRAPRRRTFIASIVLASLQAIASATTPSVPTDVADACGLGDDFLSFWFGGPPTLDGAVHPADSLQLLTPKNCGFYAWSEQMFLWLTSPAPASYGGGAHVFESPAFYDVSPPDVNGQRTFLAHTPRLVHAFPLRMAQLGAHGLPVVKDLAGTLFEFAKPGRGLKALVRGPTGAPVEIAHARLDRGRLVLFDPAGGVIQAQHVASLTHWPSPRDFTGTVPRKFVIDGFSIFIDSALAVIDVEQGQADDAGVLQAQTAANGSLVYYATMVNDVYAYFLTGYKQHAIKTSFAGQFPTTPFDLQSTIAFATAHGKGNVPFPDPNALAVEIKTSWVLAAGLPDLGSYITMRATIPVYDKSNPDAWTQTGQQTVQLAMVGMHVVGSTFMNPEMVWATFEHDRNTPSAAYSYTSTTGPKKIAQDTSGTWLFSASDATGPFNVPHMTFADATNQIQAVAPFHVSPSDTLRTMPWGSSDALSSNDQVISMNHRVRTGLVSGDVRANYKMIGATWTVNGTSPGPTNLGVGTSRLANSTIETYQQGGGSNCFSCHVGVGTQGSLDPNGLSHIFGDDKSGLKPLF